MTTGDFIAEDWIEFLAQALTELATTQGRYRDELDQIEREMSRWKGFDHPSDTLREFYSLACVGKDRYHAGEYGPLCAALAGVRSVLVAHPALAEAWGVPAVHPAWAGRVEPPETRDDIWIQILSHGYRGSLSSMIARLMEHRREGPDGGLRRAAAELDGLLAPRGNLEQSSLPDDLSVGYHVALFHGLRVGEQVLLAGDITILPFEQWGTFVNERILQDFAPAILRDLGTRRWIAFRTCHTRGDRVHVAAGGVPSPNETLQNCRAAPTKRIKDHAVERCGCEMFLHKGLREHCEVWAKRVKAMPHTALIRVT